jgi:large subunit ribosomal protein L4
VKLRLRNIKGHTIGSVEVSDRVFNAPMNKALVHQVMVGQLANARQGTAHVKTRRQVSGGGAKPRPQKYTGRARQGSIRAPQWRGGGVVFGPAPRSYRHHTPIRMRRQALLAMLSDKAREDQLIVLDSLELETPKTREMVRVLAALDVDSSVLLVADGADAAVLRSANNIPKIKTLPASLLNTLDLLNHRKLVMTLDAVRRAEELWSAPYSRRKRQAVEV